MYGSSMRDTTSDFFDTFSENEAHGVEAMMRDVDAIPWAQPLLKSIADNGGLNGGNKSLFFELRFGHALHTAGIIPEYEIPGESGSTIDFGFQSGKCSFRVELMRLTETAAAKAATHETIVGQGVPLVTRELSTDAADPKQSEEGETLKAVERICQKCERDGKPWKFPPTDGLINVLLVDFRTFLHGGDVNDRIHVALGGKKVGSHWYRRYWEEKLITGVFSPETTLRGGTEARSRLNFIGFINEKTYEPGGFPAATQFVANPQLLTSADEARAVLAEWPLQPAELIAGR